jgi:hypothetical protein
VEAGIVFHMPSSRDTACQCLRAHGTGTAPGAIISFLKTASRSERLLPEDQSVRL